MARAVVRLTRREEQAARDIMEGLSIATIARREWLTQEAVKFHRSNLYGKLGLRGSVPNVSHDYSERQALISSALQQHGIEL